VTSSERHFVVALNPDASSSLPYLIRLPLGAGERLFKARDRWPRTAAVYCHPTESWPEDAEILEEIAVRSCVRRGKAIDLVLARSRENRSQFVLTTSRGREMILWQSARTTAKARPGVRVPTRRPTSLGCRAPRRGPDPLPERPDRLLRDPPSCRGVVLPLARSRPYVCPS